MKVIMGMVIIMGMVTPLAAQGTDYQPTLGKVSYGLFKSTIGATVYATAREAGIKRTPAAILGIVGPLVVGKAIAWGQGHRVPPVDILHDAAWFGVFVLPLASRKPGRLVIAASLILFTCHGASPRMC